MSDHLALPNTASELLNQSPRHNLFMMPGVSPDTLVNPQDAEKAASLMDVAPTVLYQMGFDIQALGYGRNLLAEERTFMQNHADPEAAIRQRFPTVRHLWQYPSLHKGLLVNLDDMKASIGTHEFSLPALITLQPNLRLDQTLASDNLLKFLEASTPEESFLWLDVCRSLPAELLSVEVDQAVDNAMCLLAGRKGHIGRAAAPLNDGGEQLVTLDTLTSFLEAPDDAGYSSALIDYLQRREAGGEVRFIPPAVSANMSRSSNQLAILASAEPLQHHAFVGWQGVHDTRRLAPMIIAAAYEATTLQPEFDVHSVSTSHTPEFRSAWAAVVKKGGVVLSDHVSPGDSRYSVSRQRLALDDGSELDVRATGGFLAKQWQNAYLRRDGEHLMPLQRGINLWVLTPNGDQENYHFDTHGEPSESVRMIATLENIPVGSLLAFVTTDEFTSALSSEALTTLNELGVLQLPN